MWPDYVRPQEVNGCRRLCSEVAIVSSSTNHFVESDLGHRYLFAVVEMGTAFGNRRWASDLFDSAIPKIPRPSKIDFSVGYMLSSDWSEFDAFLNCLVERIHEQNFNAISADKIQVVPLNFSYDNLNFVRWPPYVKTVTGITYTNC